VILIVRWAAFAALFAKVVDLFFEPRVARRLRYRGTRNAALCGKRYAHMHSESADNGTAAET